jgi:hypothetical protein
MIDRETRSRIKTATIPEWVALDLLRDIDSAIRHRDAAQLRNFAAEAVASGMDQEAARAREIVDVIEAKAGASAREELLRIKAALQPPPPSQADLVRRYDTEQLAAMANRGAPFSVNDFEENERRRVEEANLQLAAKQRRHEEQRAAQVAAAARPKGPGR